MFDPAVALKDLDRGRQAAVRDAAHALVRLQRKGESITPRIYEARDDWKTFIRLLDGGKCFDETALTRVIRSAKDVVSYTGLALPEQMSVLAIEHIPAAAKGYWRDHPGFLLRGLGRRLIPTTATFINLES